MSAAYIGWFSTNWTGVRFVCACVGITATRKWTFDQSPYTESISKVKQTTFQRLFAWFERKASRCSSHASAAHRTPFSQSRFSMKGCHMHFQTKFYVTFANLKTRENRYVSLSMVFTDFMSTAESWPDVKQTKRCLLHFKIITKKWSNATSLFQFANLFVPITFCCN